MPAGCSYSQRGVVKMRNRLLTPSKCDVFCCNCFILQCMCWNNIDCPTKYHSTKQASQEEKNTAKRKCSSISWNTHIQLLVLSLGGRSTRSSSDTLVYVFVAHNKSGKQLLPWQHLKNELRHSQWDRQEQVPPPRQEPWFDTTMTPHKPSSGSETFLKQHHGSVRSQDRRPPLEHQWKFSTDTVMIGNIKGHFKALSK